MQAVLAFVEDRDLERQSAKDPRAILERYCEWGKAVLVGLRLLRPILRATGDPVTDTTL